MPARRKGTRVGKYRSKFEAKHVPPLEALGATYEPVDMEYIVNEVRRYTPDVILPNGIVVEFKGYLTPDDRKKLILVRDQYPDIDLRIVFQSANAKFSSTSKTTYATWATKHGIMYGAGMLPATWVTEPPNVRSLRAIAKLKQRNHT